MSRPILPGESDRFRISLRFGPAGTPLTTLAGDIYKAFASTYPFTLQWKDRRPIGYLHLDSSEKLET